MRPASRPASVGRTAPGHHKGGWHLTGTLGSIAAGVAGGKLLGLDAQKLTYAMGIAATQAGGMQQNRGTMCKSLHAGKAAANGVLAACSPSAASIRRRRSSKARRALRASTATWRSRSADRGPRQRLADREQRPQALCLRRRAASPDRRGDRDPQPRRIDPAAVSAIELARAIRASLHHRRGRADDRLQSKSRPCI